MFFTQLFTMSHHWRLKLKFYSYFFQYESDNSYCMIYWVSLKAHFIEEDMQFNQISFLGIIIVYIIKAINCSHQSQTIILINFYAF